MTKSSLKSKSSLATDVAKVFAAIPTFAALPAKVRKTLASRLQKIVVKAGDFIVEEHEFVDAIYIVLAGEAEVSHRLKGKVIPLAMLTQYETIGLNETGFYSDSGKRTASVKAIDDVTLLKLEMEDLMRVLKAANLESALVTSSEQFLRMQLIKKSLPFSKLSQQRIQWLADKVETLNLLSDEILFYEGDEGDKCYLILRGTIALYTTQADGEKKRIALLKKPAFFGEATLVMHRKRNATAIAKTETELLVLDHHYLAELIETEKNVAQTFLSLMMNRSRPKKNPEVSLNLRHTADVESVYILKNAVNNRYFRLSEEGLFVWERLTGENTLQEITLQLLQAHHIFAPAMVTALISKLTKNGFIENDFSLGEMQASVSGWARWFRKAKQLLEYQYSVKNANRIITASYQRGIHYLFTKPARWIFILLSAFGLAAFITITPGMLNYLSQERASWLILLALLPLSICETLLHELGHAYAVKYYGRDIHYLGVGWYWFGPIAFADTSDMWIAPRKGRIMVSVAGIFVDLISAGCAAIIGLFVHSSLLWLFALYTYVNALRMLSPLQEMDGYYILMDCLEKNRLRQSAVLWLIRKAGSCVRHPSQCAKYKKEITYWLACLVYLVCVSLMTLFLVTFIFSIIGINANPYVSLALPFLAVMISSFSIIEEVKEQSD